MKTDKNSKDMKMNPTAKKEQLEKTSRTQKSGITTDAERESAPRGGRYAQSSGAKNSQR